MHAETLPLFAKIKSPMYPSLIKTQHPISKGTLGALSISTLDQFYRHPPVLFIKIQGNWSNSTCAFLFTLNHLHTKDSVLYNLAPWVSTHFANINLYNSFHWLNIYVHFVALCKTSLLLTISYSIWIYKWYISLDLKTKTSKNTYLLINNF